MQREGVDVERLKTDKERLTALVLLSVESEGVSPMIFYRDRLRRHGAGRGRHRRGFHRLGAVHRGHRHAFFPTQQRRRAAQGNPLMKARGGKVVFDIDYRPNLWGLAGHAEGERYVASERVSAQLKSVLPDCDLIVGTEEEIMIASGADELA
jgi:5-dehydro-2-deoxygluconokinase